jgi:hypothetical protein
MSHSYCCLSLLTAMVRHSITLYTAYLWDAGFSAGGTNMVFEGNRILNGDDCLTVGNGAHNITWRFISCPVLPLPGLTSTRRNSYCEGGHGLSIGSLGSGGSVADVQNVLCVSLLCFARLYSSTPEASKRLSWYAWRLHDV